MPDEEIKRIMEDYGLDKEDAEKVQRIMEEEGLGEEEAVELKDDL